MEQQTPAAQAGTREEVGNMTSRFIYQVDGLKLHIDAQESNKIDNMAMSLVIELKCKIQRFYASYVSFTLWRFVR